MVDEIRRKLLKTGAAAAAMAAAPSVLAQQRGGGESGRFYQKGNVRIRYEETGSGFPLLLIPGGGLNGSTIEGIRGGDPFNTIEAFKGEFRCLYADLRNSAGRPPPADRPAVGFLRRRPSRSDGSPADRQVHGAGLLHCGALDLEPCKTGAQSRRRGRAGAAGRVPAGAAKRPLRESNNRLRPCRSSSGVPRSRVK